MLSIHILPFFPSFFFFLNLLPMTDFSKLTEFKTLEPSVLFPIACKSYPVTCIWLTLSHKISSLNLNTPLCIPVVNHRLKKMCLMSSLTLPGSSFQLLALIILSSSWLKSWVCFPHENTCLYNQVPSQSSFWWAKQIKSLNPPLRGIFSTFQINTVVIF